MALDAQGTDDPLTRCGLIGPLIAQRHCPAPPQCRPQLVEQHGEGRAGHRCRAAIRPGVSWRTMRPLEILICHYRERRAGRRRSVAIRPEVGRLTRQLPESLIFQRDPGRRRVADGQRGDGRIGGYA